MTLNPICENVETAQGVPLTVTGVAQVRHVKNEEVWTEDNLVAGEDHEEPRAAAHGLRAVPRQEGARDQEHRAPDARGSPEGNSR